MSIRQSLKRMLPPPVLSKYREVTAPFRGTVHRHAGTPDAFDRIYHDNHWGSDSVSGPGSERRETQEVRDLLPDLIRRYEITSLLDAPCGDFSWIQLVDLGACRYTGVDVVSALIESNRRQYQSQGRAFSYADLRRDPLPRTDMILCRDCLIHLSHRDAFDVLLNFKASGSTYLLVTTHPTEDENLPIKTGDFRGVNLQIWPFKFPEPLELHRDRYRADPGTTMIDPHKSLGLWRLADLPLAPNERPLWL